MIADLQIKKIYWCGCFYFNGEGKGSGQICFHYINRFIHYITMVDNFPYLHKIFRDLMFLIFHFNSFIFRDLNKNSKGKRPANPPQTWQERKQTAKGRKQQDRKLHYFNTPHSYPSYRALPVPLPSHTQTPPPPTQTPKKKWGVLKYRNIQPVF